MFEYMIMPTAPLLRMTVFATTCWLVVSCGGEKPKVTDAVPGAASISIEGQILRPEALSQAIQVSGTIIPFESTVLQPEVSGRTVLVNLPEGKTVAKGTLLVKIFDGELQAQLKKLEVQLDIARATELRQKQLLEINGISQQEYDLSLLQVRNLESEMELIRVQIGKTELRAPFSGTIGLKQISQGAYITPGTTVATLRQINRLKLDFSVPEKYSSEVRAGQEITFRVEGSDELFQATVLATEEGVNEDTRTLNVRAVVKENSRQLVPGSFAQILLTLAEHNDALMVPTQSIIPQARDKRVIVSRGGVAEFVPVKTGIRKEDVVEVTEGLQPGDTIVVTGMLFLRPGAKLQFASVK